jgi:hypothetical protein
MKHVAERVGFEPTVPISRDSRLAGDPDRPLQHLSAGTLSGHHFSIFLARVNPTEAPFISEAISSAVRQAVWGLIQRQAGSKDRFICRQQERAKE